MSSHPPISGLSHQQVKQKQQEHGPNILTKAKKDSWFKKLLAEFKDLMILLLIGAAIIAIINNELIDGIVILAIVVFNAGISFIQQYRAEKALESLQKLVAPHAKVLRDDKVQIVDSSELVPGDIVLLEAGDRIPADGKLVQCSNLHAQESVLTGESTPVSKESTSKVFLGTEVTHGLGRMEVIAIGNKTEFGRIAHLTQTTESDLSPLQKEVHHIGLLVTKITLVIASLLFAYGYWIQDSPIVDTLLFATSVAVAAVPEGLPATITIALALGVQRLAKKNAIVKNLSSAETLGSTSCIISDKTGTLTRNQMTVVKLATTNITLNISGSGYKAEGKLGTELATPHLQLIQEIGQYCHSTNLDKTEDGQIKVAGDPTEAAIIVLGQKVSQQFSLKELKNNIKKVNPFDSERKRMSVLVENKLLAKGAPEQILDISNRYLDSNGKVQPLTASIREQILKQNNQFADEALRVLAYAYQANGQDTEEDLIFGCLVGILDPPREEVKDVIQKAKQAGIHIIVATGDHGQTAKAIAKSLDIITDQAKILTNADLEHLDETDLRKILSEESDLIFARVNPEDKLRIARALQANGQIIAMTGDGVNDAPALKQADIGIAMGITGTDVSQEAANMVLADDKFNTIITAIAEGRRIYENLRKIVYYLFSSNIGELVLIFVALIVGLPQPLSAVLLLLINVGTDAFPAIALSIDPADGTELNRRPRPQKARILDPIHLRHIVSNGLIIGSIALLSYLNVFWTNNWDFSSPEIQLKATTAAFVTLIFVQGWNAINASFVNQSIISYLRQQRIGLFALIRQKWLLVFNAALSIGIAWALTIMPWSQNIFGLTTLSINLWLTISILSFSIVIFDEIYKRFFLQPSA